MKWISVKERMPKNKESYIVWGTPTCGNCGNKATFHEAYFNLQNEWSFGGYECSMNVTHWMQPKTPMPEGPGAQEAKS